ncbi:hypothetical protein [Aliikangiella maris]|uniref:Uncharacterized protein n=2 Tax=Aliikangiella maris TaxID=3162458 RepID=A0ABV3MKQ6_9GAMM
MKKAIIIFLVIITIILIFLVDFLDGVKQVELPIVKDGKHIGSGVFLEFINNKKSESDAWKTVESFFELTKKGSFKKAFEKLNVEQENMTYEQIKNSFLDRFYNAVSIEKIEGVTYGEFANFIVKIELLNGKLVNFHIKLEKINNEYLINQVNSRNPINSFVGMFFRSAQKNQNFEVINKLSVFSADDKEELAEGVSVFTRKGGLFDFNIDKKLGEAVLKVEKEIEGEARYYISSNDLMIVYFDISKNENRVYLNKGRDMEVIYFFFENGKYSYDLDKKKILDDLILSEKVVSLLREL